MSSITDHLNITCWILYIRTRLMYFNPGAIVWPTMPELLVDWSPLSNNQVVAEGLRAAFYEMQEMGFIKPAKGAGRWIIVRSLWEV